MQLLEVGDRSRLHPVSDRRLLCPAQGERERPDLVREGARQCLGPRLGVGDRASAGGRLAGEEPRRLLKPGGDCLPTARRGPKGLVGYVVCRRGHLLQPAGGTSADERPRGLSSASDPTPMSSARRSGCPICCRTCSVSRPSRRRSSRSIRACSPPASARRPGGSPARSSRSWSPWREARQRSACSLPGRSSVFWLPASCAIVSSSRSDRPGSIATSSPWPRCAGSSR